MLTIRLSIGILFFCTEPEYLKGIWVATSSAQNMKKAKTKKQTW